MLLLADATTDSPTRASPAATGRPGYPWATCETLPHADEPLSPQASGHLRVIVTGFRNT